MNAFELRMFIDEGAQREGSAYADLNYTVQQEATG
jgi:hypothetical protein